MIFQNKNPNFGVCKNTTYFYFEQYVVFLISGIDDDTPGSLTGAAIFSYFYSLLIVIPGYHETQQ
jgi:hypothetical protein